MMDAACPCCIVRTTSTTHVDIQSLLLQAIYQIFGGPLLQQSLPIELLNWTPKLLGVWILAAAHHCNWSGAGEGMRDLLGVEVGGEGPNTLDLGPLIRNKIVARHLRDGHAIISKFQAIYTVIIVVIITWILSILDVHSPPFHHQFFKVVYRSKPQIRGTSIEGLKAVELFKSRLVCFSAGRWEYNDTPRHIPWIRYGNPFAERCDKVHKAAHVGNIAFPEADLVADQGGEWKVRESLKWTWQTNSTCPFLHVNRVNFCKRMGSKRNVLIIGDSINHQLQSILMNHLITNYSIHGYRQIQGFDKGEEVCGDVLDGGGFTVSFIKSYGFSPNKTLIPSNDPRAPNKFADFGWLDLIDQWNVKILVLNQGAHYRKDETFAASLRVIFSILRDQYPNLLVLYRNTPPGHLNCSSYKEPLQKRQPPDNLPFHWGDFRDQNEIARYIVERAGYIYMDVDSMLSLRPDGHLEVTAAWSNCDCLHYCIPGPPDVVVQLFYNILTLIDM